MKAQDLPEGYKKYILSLTDKTKYTITGTQKESILNSNGQFVELPDGSIVNKVHIVAIHFEKELTTDKFKELDSEEQKKLAGSLQKI